MHAWPTLPFERLDDEEDDDALPALPLPAAIFT
jgi:hypothetical protein